MKSLKQAHVIASFLIAMCSLLSSVNLQSKTDQESFKETKIRAEGGDANSQLSLAYMYHFGQGATRDDKEAVKWYHKAAEQGSAKAQYMLAAIYLNGQGVTQDDKEVVKWLRKAAE